MRTFCEFRAKNVGSLLPEIAYNGIKCLSNFRGEFQRNHSSAILFDRVAITERSRSTFKSNFSSKFILLRKQIKLCEI